MDRRLQTPFAGIETKEMRAKILMAQERTVELIPFSKADEYGYKDANY